jgi:serine/threonine-protein kinase
MFKARQRFGKYIIERRLGEGGFAVVYQARDTIEGIRVALKVPYQHLVSAGAIETFRHEVRVAAQLEHPNILPLKYADFIDGRFVIVTALGQMTLDKRLRKRISVNTALNYTEQMIAAVAHAHEHRIIHCDIKPDNFLLFPGNRLKLTDFGIARFAQRTLRGSGAGTVGYIAPEQAMGKPSFRSDVFSLGLVIYRMFTGCLPEWPFDWPPPGYFRLRHRFDPDLIELLRKSLKLNARQRYKDARQLQSAFVRIKKSGRRRKKSGDKTTSRRHGTSDWRKVRHREFQQQFGKALETRHACEDCGAPIAESMRNCPWCSKLQHMKKDQTSFPSQCPRCHRGLKLDWRYCPWCYGAGFEPLSRRPQKDRRYKYLCDNPRCTRKQLMPFMRYCPWCHRRVRKKWKVEGSRDRCKRCGWGVVPSFWSYCPWCAARLNQ